MTTGGAGARAADRDDAPVLGQLVDPALHLPERDGPGAGRMAGGPLVGLADVEEQRAGVDQRPTPDRVDFGYRVIGHRRLLHIGRHIGRHIGGTSGDIGRHCSWHVRRVVPRARHGETGGPPRAVSAEDVGHVVEAVGSQHARRERRTVPALAVHDRRPRAIQRAEQVRQRREWDLGRAPDGPVCGLAGVADVEELEVGRVPAHSASCSIVSRELGVNRSG